MKKILFTASLIIAFFNAPLFAGDKKTGKKQIAAYSYPKGRENIIEEKNTLTNRKIELLVNRANEIYQMDKTSMSSSEKKQIRSEAKEIKKQLTAQKDQYVYISLTAVLLIIIILILIL